ncbi:hypothetical protein BH23ACT3_BH23ACT3_02570 [soil metagenome]
MSTPDHPEHPELDHLEPRLRDLLHGVADDVHAPDHDLDRVRRRGRRRRNAGRTLVATFSVVALLAVGLVTAQFVGDRGDEGFTVSGPAPEPTSAPASESDAPTGTATDAAVDVDDGVWTTVVEPSAAPGGVGVVDDPGAPIVAWGDGFARVGMRYEPPTIGPLSDEVVALFPPEVVEFFEGRLPSTVSEGLEMLEDRPELLDEIQRVMAEHPEAAAAIQGGPSTGRMFVDTSPDGLTWERAGELDLPDGMDHFSNVVSTGTRLVVAGQTWEPSDTDAFGDPGSSGVMIASTSDLRQWDSVQPITTGDNTDTPAGVTRHEYVSGLDAGPGGVVLTMTESLEPRIESLVPPEVRSQLESGVSYSTSTGPDGVTIEIMGEGREVTVVGPDNTEQLVYEEGDVLETYDFTWDELGVDPTFADGSDQSVSVWTGDLAAGLTEAAPLAASGWSSYTAATGDGGVAVVTADMGSLVLWYTADGTSWIDRSPPLDGDAWASGLFRTVGGLTLLVHIDGVLETWWADSSAQGWTRADMPAFGDGQYGWIALSAAGPAGTAVLFSLETGPQVGTVLDGDATVERDGYRVTIRYSGGATSADLVRIGVVGAPDELVYAWDEIGARPEHTVEHSDGGLTFLDPDTGEELVTITSDDFDRAFADAFGDDFGDDVVTEGPGTYEYTPPGYVLMWTVDGTNWEQLDRIEPGEPVESDAEFAMGERWPTGLVVTETQVLLAISGGGAGTEIRTYSP